MGPSSELIPAAAAKFGLTERQAALAFAYAERGTMTAAARALKTSAAEGHRLLREHSGFIAAVREALDAALARDAVRARAVIYRLMESAESERIRLDAAKALKDWAIGSAPQRHIHEHQFQGDPAALRSRIDALLSELGLDKPPATIEGSFTRSP